MHEIKLKLLEIREWMPYGKIKALAAAHGVKYTKAKDIMAGRVEISQAEEAFIYECFDIAKERKNRLQKINSF